MSQRQSMNGLIAWLSVCLLAAAWGPTLGPNQRLTWSYFGALGLAAAVGLDALARTRRASRERLRQQNLATEQQRRLTQFDAHGRSSLAIREVARRIADDARWHQQPRGIPPVDSASLDGGLGRESRQGCWIPARLFLAPDATDSAGHNDGGKVEAQEKGIAAYIRDISATGIGLCHAESVEVKEAVVRVELSGGDRVSMLATQCWCRSGGEGWNLSGWKLSAVLTEVDDPSAEPRQATCSGPAHAGGTNGQATMADCTS